MTAPLRALFLALLLALLPTLPRAHGGDEAEVRALWVTRYDYRTAEDVRRIVREAAGLGVNRVLFQVRGSASVFFPSRLEPWTERLGGKDPGFDPLAVAADEARAQGVALEAWINAMPLWKGKGEPQDPRHPYRAHPEWVVVGSDGKPQRRSAHYVCANPARADVRAHVAAVCSEIAGRYRVDAVHLDYIRYVTDLEGALDFSHDEVSLRAFGKDPAQDPAGWRRFKADQVTETVRAIRAAVRAARPGCRLTAAVYPTRESRAKVSQDVERWAREDLVDAIYPMTYADRPEEFQRRIRESLPLGERPGKSPVPVYPGVGVLRHPDPQQTLRQVETARAAGARGFALFCYASFFASADGEELVVKDEALRSARVAAVRRFLGSKR
ncbi:MAG: glycoside hydrolase family 10 protein [Planctomycetota bacterium]